MPKLLTEADVRAALKMPALIDAMEGALAAFSAGRVTQPVRTVLEVGADRNYFGVMPASVDDEKAVGAKLVTVYHANHARGLASHQATIVLLDHATGELVALLDGRYITEARTAAVSAVSVRHLANTDAPVLAILGSGVQRLNISADHTSVIARGVFSLPLEDVLRRHQKITLFGSIGLAHSTEKRSVTELTTSTETKVSENDDGLALGAGVIFEVSRMRLRATLQSLDREGPSLNSVGVAAEFRF